MLDLVEQLRKNPFVLAPMAGITDCPFRSFMRDLGCSVVISELVSSNGLKYNGEKTYKLMRFEKKQSPYGIQLFGETPEIIADAAKLSQDYGADFIDMNFGCPVKKVVKKGAGSAILKDLKQMATLLKKVKAAIDIPLTIKIRTGWDEDSRNADEVCKIAYNEGITWVAIHGRTRAAAYSGKADWDYIKKIKESAPLPVLGNGDLTSPRLAVERLRDSGCDGVMIGRGCLKNPFIFRQSLALWQQTKDVQPIDYLETMNRLVTALENFYEERIVKIQLRKFAAWFSAGYPKSSDFRKSLYACDDLSEMKGRARDYFAEMQKIEQLDTSGEDFLMGGHG